MDLDDMDFHPDMQPDLDPAEPWRRRPYISITRGWRAAWVHWEFQPEFWKFGIASPNRHRCWAFTIYVYW